VSARSCDKVDQVSSRKVLCTCEQFDFGHDSSLLAVGRCLGWLKAAIAREGDWNMLAVL
jgi:hypothetical protein